MSAKSHQLSAVSAQPGSRRSFMRRRRSASARFRSRGFTLMELMVSVAILLALLTMVGVIFSTASKAGGQASALTTVHRQLAVAAEAIRRDLANMDPANDVLGIAGMQVNVRDDRKIETNMGWHRADVLMLLTRRGDTRPYVYRANDPQNDFSDHMQVVYGHADTVAADDFGAMSGLKQIENGGIPAYDWHLARRTVLFPTISAAGVGADRLPLTRDSFLVGGADVTNYALADYAAFFPAGHFQYLGYAGGALREAYLADFSPPYSYKFTPGIGWRLYHSSEGRWYRSGGGGGSWVRFVQDATEVSLFAITPNLDQFQGPLKDEGVGSNAPGLDKHFYDSTAPLYRRTVIDPSPLRLRPERMGAHFLPNCSDFRVEYTYDDPRDVHPAHEYPLAGNVPGDYLGSGSPVTRPIDWRVVPSGEQWVWSKLSANPADRTDPHRWPRAVRITLRVVDAGGRLEDPVTYTIVHAWN